jgi:hypothetical protein
MSSFTPGPWRAESAGEKWEINSDGPGWASVADVCSNRLGVAEVTAEQAGANALLIAAAPDLLAACVWAVQLCEANGYARGSIELAAARNALTKVRGGVA